MKVKELKEILKTYDDEALVYVGCEGYSNFESPKDEYEIDVMQIYSNPDAVLISDSCYYDDL